MNKSIVGIFVSFYHDHIFWSTRLYVNRIVDMMLARNIFCVTVTYLPFQTLRTLLSPNVFSIFLSGRGKCWSITLFKNLENRSAMHRVAVGSTEQHYKLLCGWSWKNQIAILAELRFRPQKFLSFSVPLHPGKLSVSFIILSWHPKNGTRLLSNLALDATYPQCPGSSCRCVTRGPLLMALLISTNIPGPGWGRDTQATSVLL